MAFAKNNNNNVNIIIETFLFFMKTLVVYTGANWSGRGLMQGEKSCSFRWAFFHSFGLSFSVQVGVDYERRKADERMTSKLVWIARQRKAKERQRGRKFGH